MSPLPEPSAIPWARYPWEQGRAYAAWLGMVGDVLRHRERLLALALYHLPDRERVLRQQLRDRLHRLSAEDDEALELLALDLLALGYTVLELPEPPAVSGLHCTLAGLVCAGAPQAALGHLLAFEHLMEACAAVAAPRCAAVHGPLAIRWLEGIRRLPSEPPLPEGVSSLGLVQGAQASAEALHSWFQHTSGGA